MGDGTGGGRGAGEMTHREFVEGYRAGTVQVRVNRSCAFQAIQSSEMGWHHRVAAQFWGFIWLLSFPAAIALAIWVWWVWGVVVFVVGQMVGKATKSSIMDSVVVQAIEDEKFFEKALATGTIRLLVQERGGG